MANRRKPRRGPAGPNVLELGDEGQYHPQGGAEPGATESGDLEAREFGVPQADLPGGINHLVNPQTIPAETPDKPRRPADYHKYHGVPSDNGQYVTPPTEDEQGEFPRAEPEPKEDFAVPVYQVAGPGDEKKIRKTFMFNIRVAAGSGAAVTRIMDRDVHRIKAKVLNEDSSIDIRISAQEEELLTESAQGSGGAGAGGLIWHGTNSYTDLEECQDAMYAITTSGSTALLSVMLVTDVAATEN